MPNLTETSPSMTSLEISELVESNHADVRRSIERLAERGVIQLPPTAKVENQKSRSNNNKVEVFIFSGDQGKRDSYVVVAQLSPEFTARLVDRWQELEGQSAPMTMAERLLASAQLLVDHERKLADLSYRQAETQAQVKALVDGEDYYTIVGYGNLIGEPVDIHRSRKIGRIASRICRENDWRIGTANHPVYGPIHSYPRQAVAMAFDAE